MIALPVEAIGAVVFFALLLAIIRYWVAAWTKSNTKNNTRDVTSSPQTGTLFITPAPSPLSNIDILDVEPIPYRPFRHGTYHPTMGLQKLNWDKWIEMDKNFLYFHKVKVAELDKSPQDHIGYVDNAQTRLGCYEMFEELTQFLTRRYPRIFFIKGGHVHNSLTGEAFPLSGITPAEALTFSAKMVQDDLVLMIKNEDGHYHLDAAAVCLPGFWRLHEKFRTSLDQLHFEAGVPHYAEKLQLAMNRHFDRMKPETAIVRNNFFIQMDDGLHWSHRMGRQDGTEVASWAKANSTGLTIDEIHFRSERQSLRRLPKSKALMFTIRTYFEPVTKIAKEPHVPGRLAEAIRAWTPEAAFYKGQQHWGPVLLPYLDKKHEEQRESGMLETIQEKEFPY